MSQPTGNQINIKKEMSLERNKEKKKSNNQLFQTSTRVQNKKEKRKKKIKREINGVFVLFFQIIIFIF